MPFGSTSFAGQSFRGVVQVQMAQEDGVDSSDHLFYGNRQLHERVAFVNLPR